jgi:CheY-like chemotaxis protein
MSGSDAALLVVDDIDDNRFALSRRLARQGYLNVTTAVDGRQALELLNSKPFDLVLLDIMMPTVNGYEVPNVVALRGVFHGVTSDVTACHRRPHRGRGWVVGLG